jgi:hypothetical protein
MRPSLICALAAVLFIAPTGQGQTSDEAKAIINKAIKAMGEDKEPENIKGLLVKSNGTLQIMGMSIKLDHTLTIALPDKFREVSDLDINGMKISAATVFDGKNAWVEVAGKVMKLDGKILDEIKEVSHLLQMTKLKSLLGKKYDLAVIGEVKVNEKPAVGLRISTKGTKDISLYFDKQTGMMAKMERQGLDATTMQEVVEERIMRSYKDKDGRKIPHEVSVLHDGNKFLEVEISEYTPLENVDPTLFEMPK